MGRSWHWAEWVVGIRVPRRKAYPGQVATTRKPEHPGLEIPAENPPFEAPRAGLEFRENRPSQGHLADRTGRVPPQLREHSEVRPREETLCRLAIQRRESLVITRRNYRARRRESQGRGGRPGKGRGPEYFLEHRGTMEHLEFQGTQENPEFLEACRDRLMIRADRRLAGPKVAE